MIDNVSNTRWINRRKAHRLGEAPGSTGFTLLEVIVAIGLTVVIVGVIGAAIRMYFVNLRIAQSNMELTELARNTLQLMGSDIRSAIQYKPVDVSGLQELIDSQAAALSGPSTNNEASGENEDEDSGGEGGTGDETSGDNGSGEEASSDEESSDTEESDEDKSSNAATPPPPPENRPRFLGSGQEIYVDVSRLPRIDQYHPILHMNSNGSFTSLPTDVKGVSYFVSFAGDEASPQPGGLYRREVDRATNEGASQGELFGIDAATRQVAAEVVAVSFRYFDGNGWRDQWDSDEQGGYPSAVEFSIAIDPARARPVQGDRYDPNATDASSLRVFRSVTKLPLAEILTPEELELIANPTQFESPGGAAQDSGGAR